MRSKIAIVGNGITNNKHGKFIDSCDKVIRMKQYVTKGYEDYVGTKVDVYASKWFSWFDNFKPYNSRDMSHVMNVDEYWFMFCDPNVDHNISSEYSKLYLKYALKCDVPQKNGSLDMHNENIDLFNIPRNKIRYYPIEYIEQLSSKLKLPTTTILDKKGNETIIEPSVGLRTIHQAINVYPNDDIYVTGFDCFLESSWYWNSNHVINNDHNYLSEKIYLEILTKTNKVIQL